MVKKRPRAIRRSSTAVSGPPSRNEPKYWRDRLYRNTFTYRGNRYEVGHWSVKIQHLGTRKTFSLRATDLHQAAVEACKLYKAIVTRGWQSLISGSNGKEGKLRSWPEVIDVPREDGPAASYWEQRLIHRKYTETLHPSAERELSVRIDHRGTGHYFPLGTDDRELAARRAMRIYRAIAGRGWATARKRFSRELSVAFRWSDNPLAWTYTTVLTQPESQRLPDHKHSAHFNKFRVGIVESDHGLRDALAWCINQQEGCSCVETFASASAALGEARRHAIDLLLVNQNLPDKPGIACMHELAAVAPKIFGLLFSVFEDSEQLFKAAPGGAPCYVFRRTPPTKILVPIEAALKSGHRTRDQF